MEAMKEYERVMEYMKDDACLVCEFGFVVSLEWWDAWTRWATEQYGRNVKPVKMQNDRYLCSFDIKIEKFKVVHPKAWDIFKEGYDHKPELLVFIVNGKPDFNPCSVYLFNSDRHLDSIGISRKSTLGQLRSYLSYKYSRNFDGEVIRFDGRILDDNSKTIEQYGLEKGSKINIPCLDFLSKGSQNKSSARPEKIYPVTGKSNYSEVQNFRHEDFIEPDPTPIVKKLEVPESRVREMANKAMNEPYFDLPLLSISQISLNLQMRIEEFIST